MDELCEEIGRRELGLVASEGHLYSGVRDTLAGLRKARYQIALCTNGGTDYVQQVVEAHGLSKFLDASRNRNSAADTKPAMVRSILVELDGRPAVVIGDRLGDIEAAHDNGLSAIAAGYGYGTDEEMAPADRVAHSPLDIPTLVAELAETA